MLSAALVMDTATMHRRPAGGLPIVGIQHL